MKNTWKTGAIAAALIGALACPLTVVHAQTPNPQGTQTEAAPPRERHPEIRHALMALEKAKQHLQVANHDFGGHRVEALAACDQAIAQLKLALQYDKN